MVFGLKQRPRAACMICLSDIDECAADRSLCQPYGSCENRPGSYSCACNHGYVLSDDKHSCEGKFALIPSALLQPHFYHKPKHSIFACLEPKIIQCKLKPP